MTRYIKLLGVFVFVTLIGLLITEGAVRIIFSDYTPVLRLYRYIDSERGKFTRYDSMLGWVGKKNTDDDFEWADTRHHVSQNQYGFRDRGLEFKRGSARRMVVLGDSFVWGFGVENEEIFTSLLEEKIMACSRW